MIKRVLIIKNISYEEPGLILEVLNKTHISYEILDFSEKLSNPNLEEYDLLIIMGGPDSANDKSAKIIKELNIINSAFKKNIPIFGICLGLQLMVKAIDGIVYRNSVEEIGFKRNKDWYRVKLTNLGLKDPIFKDIKEEFIVFQLHGETVELNDNIELLGIGKYCRNQIIKIANFNYGFQFHFELTPDLLKDWIELAPELRNYNTNQFFRDFEEIMEDYLKRGKKIFKNYLEIWND
ncbi:MAG: type 1 glutamine amidotransferase [Promethearchaeota archaeon]